MWQLHMAERGAEWAKIDDFETLSAAALRILELEGYSAGGVFFDVYVETHHGNDAEFLGHLEHTGRKTGRCYGVKRVRH
jgi:hypothetical protein